MTDNAHLVPSLLKFPATISATLQQTHREFVICVTFVKSRSV